VADRMGLEGHHADFGQTLALAGGPSGPYLMVPGLGPPPARDGGRALLGLLFEPTTYILTPGAQLVFASVRGTGSGLSAWETQSDALHALQASSIDFYAALRNAYWQNRVAEIERPPQRFALARRCRRPRASTQGSLAPPGGEVVEAGANRALQLREALAVEDRGEVGPPERQL